MTLANVFHLTALLGTTIALVCAASFWLVSRKTDRSLTRLENMMATKLEDLKREVGETLEVNKEVLSALGNLDQQITGLKQQIADLIAAGGGASEQELQTLVDSLDSSQTEMRTRLAAYSVVPAPSTDDSGVAVTGSADTPPAASNP